MLNFRRPTRLKFILARVEEHAAEKIGGRFERRGIAGTQLAIDFRSAASLEERMESLSSVRESTKADVVTLREEDVDFGDAALGKRPARDRRSAACLASSRTSPVWRLTTSATL